jgi:hypothetical protein
MLELQHLRSKAHSCLTFLQPPSTLREVRLPNGFWSYSSLTYLASALPNLTRVCFDCAVPSKDLVALTALQQLQSLSLGGFLEGAELPLLAGLPLSSFLVNHRSAQGIMQWLSEGGGQRLQHLSVLLFDDYSGFSNEVVPQLAQLQQLRSLEISSMLVAFPRGELSMQLQQFDQLSSLSLSFKAKDEVLVTQLPPNLLNFSIRNASMVWPDCAQQALAALGQLTSLALLSHCVSDTSMPSIGRLTNLQQLQLESPNVTAAGVQHLGSLSRLTQLSLLCSLGRGGVSFNMQVLEKLTRLQRLTFHCPGALDLASAVTLNSSLTRLTEFYMKSEGRVDTSFEAVRGLVYMNY